MNFQRVKVCTFYHFGVIRILTDSDFFMPVTVSCLNVYERWMSKHIVTIIHGEIIRNIWIGMYECYNYSLAFNSMIYPFGFDLYWKDLIFFFLLLSSPSSSVLSPDVILCGWLGSEQQLSHSSAVFGCWLRIIMRWEYWTGEGISFWGGFVVLLLLDWT